MKTYNKICKTCNNGFISTRSHAQFCKRLCYRQHPDNRTKYNDRVKVYQNAHSKEPSRRFEKLKHKCKFEQRELNISKDEFVKLVTQVCSYCSSSLKEETGCGLDRIDNLKDYLLNNVIPCCGSRNQIRNVHLTYDEMKVAMAAVVEFRNLGEP